MKYGLLVLLIALAAPAIACEGCGEGPLTVYDDSTPEARHRTQLINLITLMIGIKDSLTPESLNQLVQTTVYVLRASEHNEQRLILLEEFVNDNQHLVNKKIDNK